MIVIKSFDTLQGIWFFVQSRVVRNANPTFIFGVRRDVVDPKSLRKDQIINHYGKATFTTKVRSNNQTLLVQQADVYYKSKK